MFVTFSFFAIKWLWDEPVYENVRLKMKFQEKIAKFT